MKSILMLLLAMPVASGQTGTSSIAGTVLDAKTQKPIPAALVMAVASGAPAFSKNTRSGGDGAFQIQGLPAGKYSLCVQAPADAYLDPCQWNGSPSTVVLASGPAPAGIVLRLTPASILSIQVQDSQKVLSQKTRDGRRPELTVGVWGPKGLFYPAHASGNPTAPANVQDGPTSYSFRLAVPRDTPLNFQLDEQGRESGRRERHGAPGKCQPAGFPARERRCQPEGLPHLPYWDCCREETRL